MTATQELERVRFGNLRRSPEDIAILAKEAEEEYIHSLKMQIAEQKGEIKGLNSYIEHLKWYIENLKGALK